MPAEAERERRLAWEGCLNVRDVGGYATEDGAQIRWRTLLRADNLCSLTPAGRDALVSHGVRTIVDLRGTSDPDSGTHPFGPGGSHAGTVGYWHWPIRDPADLELQQAFLAATTLLDTYILNVDRCGPRIAAVARAFAEAPDGGFLIHCHVGKDRTGVVIALLLALAGVPRETIVADYILSEEHLRPLYDASRAAGQGEVWGAWRSAPETMHALLDHLDRSHGGPRAYLAAAGLTDREIAVVRARLRE
jgi:protein-tyrosine phosphatase